METSAAPPTTGHSFEEVVLRIAEELDCPVAVEVLPEACLNSLEGSSIYTLAEYRHGGFLPPSITVFEGSFGTVLPGCGLQELFPHIRGVLQHEIRHHEETEIGTADLVIDDALRARLRRQRLPWAKRFILGPLYPVSVGAWLTLGLGLLFVGEEVRLAARAPWNRPEGPMIGSLRGDNQPWDMPVWLEHLWWGWLGLTALFWAAVMWLEDKVVR